MKLTPKLLGHLNRVFDKDPQPFNAVRFNYAGSMSWAVQDARLTTIVSGGPGADLSVDLSQHTLGSLAALIAGSAGYSVTYIAPGMAGLSARVLLDGAADQSESNGDRLLAYGSILYAFMEAMASELQAAGAQVVEMLRQMSTTSAEDAWLDELGSYYRVIRTPGEPDTLYGPRIIAETLRPMSNNVAIERAIEDYTGQACEVLNVTIYRGVSPLYDGSISFDGTHNYDAPGSPNYGLFDVSVGYDLIGGGDLTDFLATVRTIIVRIRAAGTFLRALALAGGSSIEDTLSPPSDATAAMAVDTTMSDTASTADDGGALAFTSDIGAMADDVLGVTEAVAGGIYATLTTQSGDPITTQSGDPILVSVGDLFA